jgi:hypothetical protein
MSHKNSRCGTEGNISPRTLMKVSIILVHSFPAEYYWEMLFKSYEIDTVQSDIRGLQTVQSSFGG